MRRCSRKMAAVLLGVSAMAFQPMAAATSTTYGFYGITENDPLGGAVADGEANLTVEVIDLGTQVQFKFFNNSTSSLTDVYFDDGTLLGIASIDSGTGVSFSQIASPGNLPGANLASPPFVTTADFSADSNPAVSLNGVTSGEWVAITFDLINGKTYDPFDPNLIDVLGFQRRTRTASTICGSVSMCRVMTEAIARASSTTRFPFPKRKPTP